VKRRIDRRRTLIPLTAIVVLLGGFVLDRLGAGDTLRSTAQTVVADAHPLVGDEAAQLAHQNFQQAVVMLQAGQYDYAVSALHEVLKIYPGLPEAHANMGYALVGLGQYDAATDFFESATDLRPTLHTAYYGLALAEDGRGDTRAALAAMQAFAHLAAGDDPYLSRAQSAMRQWESELSPELPERTP